MGLGGWLQEQLFERRIVMLTGRLDADAASRAAAVLTALDADGAPPIELHLDSGDGELAAALVVIDSLGALRASVRATARFTGSPAQLAAQSRQQQEGATWTLSRPSPTGSSTRWFDKGEDASLASAKAFTRRPLRTPGGTTWARSSAWA
jgi:ATP-dependent Clp protease protease subunit